MKDPDQPVFSTDEHAPSHARPDGVDDATVKAVGKFSEGYEYLIRARGHLYSLHQLIGRADILFGEAAEMLETAGHKDLGQWLGKEIVGRNVLDGRWTFQMVEEFDHTYYEPVTVAEKIIRDGLMAGRYHVYESEMKEARRKSGRPGHERRPLQAFSPEIETEAGTKPIVTSGFLE